MKAKSSFWLLVNLLGLAIGTQLSLPLFAQCDLSQGCAPVDKLTTQANGTGQVYMGDGASNDGNGGWTTAHAASTQCLSCHYGADTMSYLTSGHKNTLRKMAPGVLWGGPDGAPYSTTDAHYGSGSTYDWTNDLVTLGWCDPLSVPAQNGRPAHDPTCSYPFYTLLNPLAPAPYTPVAPTPAAGGQQTLYYIFGGWENYGGPGNPAASHIGTIFSNGFTGGLYPNGNFDCARCHATGYNFDASGPEPTQNTNGVVAAIADAQFSRIPSDGYKAPGTNGTSSWYLSGIQCERCHQAAWSYGSHTTGSWDATMPREEAATALCLECHRGETVLKANPNTVPPTPGSVTPVATPKTQDLGYCSDLSGSSYATCVANSSNTWIYKPSFEHEAGATFLNGPHARFNGSIVQNAQHSPDLSVTLNGTYNSLFSPDPANSSKNSGCVGCHDPHQSVNPSTKLPEPYVCNDCHSLSNNILQQINHPTGPGTPFPTGTAADIPGACVICHMVAADGKAKSHLFRINTGDYATFPTPDQLHNQGITAPNTVSDGISANAAWNDVDLACGQCHIGGNGSQNPYGLTPPAASAFAPQVTKSYLEQHAAEIHGSDVPLATPTFTPAGGNFTAPQSVTLADSASSATIYYTTDGSTPPSSTMTEYTGTPIQVAGNTTLRAIAVGVGGWSKSLLATGFYSFVTATPTISPASNTYTTPQTVSFADVTPNVTYYYTTDGSTPTSSSTVYTGPFTISTPTTVKVIAVSSFGTSTMAIASYNFSYPTAAQPTFSPAPIGTFSSAVSVTLADSTPGAKIYYTTNGSTPTSSSTLYTGAISVTTTTTIKAIAIATAYNNSNVSSGTYTIVAAQPTFNPVPIGTFNMVQSVTLSDATPGVTIYYTTNGTTPTTSSTVYSAAIPVTTTTTIKAIAAGNGYGSSSVASGTYTLQAGTPRFSPAPVGTFSSPQTVTLSDVTPGVSFYYTTDGSTPTTSSTLYTGSIPVSTTTTIKAVAAGNGFSVSQVGSATYTISGTTGAMVSSAAPVSTSLNGSSNTAGNGAIANGDAASEVSSGTYNLVASTPVFAPAPGGTYHTLLSVRLSDATPGATIYYTTDGSTPTTASTPYMGPISVISTTTIKAIAASATVGASSVASGTYIVQAEAPAFSPEPKGTFHSPLMVTLTDVTPGVTIYYTTDGTTPTNKSTPYSKPIKVTSSITIKAIAVGNGYSASTITGARYAQPLQVWKPIASGRKIAVK